MALEIFDWQRKIAGMTLDANVNIRYVKLSEVNGYGFFVSIVPLGEGTVGHWHPHEDEKYHFTKGEGVLLSQTVEQLEAGAVPVRQQVKEGMTVDIPRRVVHRLVNNGREPLTFFFECSMAHMAEANPQRTMVPDFGGSLAALTSR